MDQAGSEVHDASPGENISRTIAAIPAPVTLHREIFNHAVQTDPCGYVLSAGRGGGGARFCDAPAVPGSSYCAPHRALCQVAPDSAAAAPIRAAFALAAERTAPPPPALDPGALPEPLEAEDEDALAALDLPRAPGWGE